MERRRELADVWEGALDILQTSSGLSVKTGLPPRPFLIGGNNTRKKGSLDLNERSNTDFVEIQISLLNTMHSMDGKKRNLQKSKQMDALAHTAWENGTTARRVIAPFRVVSFETYGSLRWYRK